MSSSVSAKWGALFWVAAAPVFLAANIVVGLVWERPGFNWTTNNISDLGNVTCGIWDTTRPRYVCSPWHNAMNGAMVLTALLLLAGFVLTWRACGEGRAIHTGQSMMLLWAVGLGLAGLFPADAHENLHFLAALLIFGLGNVGLLIAGFARRDTCLGRSRFVTLGLGLLGVAGTTLFFAQKGPVIGVGGMERVAAFALPLWAFYIGVDLLRGPRSARHYPRALGQSGSASGA
ncbi:hypothetical protein GCM10010435_82090 [Winogradskya consettensis]|uniref:DUF998 domain-containing protein n=1 Tax=Winogradskya consettensis TaxID=113560 RepID=A0A919VY26_9ACTN|nr:DUF998 domain-containing protein [Actinoplanes consettensis]GIM79075.1 hypothetical protein Aco04nite_63670 [Actinoplanes consettensis]